MPTKPYIIALEEHYFDPEVKRHITGLDMTNAPRIVERLDDVDAANPMFAADPFG